MNTKESITFTKGLNLIDSTFIVIGSMIGSGIFIVSSDMSRILGSPGWLLIAWIITGILTISAALSYGELAAMMPNAGGQYIYLRESYNPLCGFLYGWTLFLVIQTGTIAAVGVAFAKFTGVIIPFFSENNIWLNLGFIKFNTVQLLAILSIIILTYINIQGLKAGKTVQNIFTSTKVLALFGLIIIGLFFAKDTFAWEINKSIFWDTDLIQNSTLSSISGFAIIIALGTAMVGSLFSSDAWNNITFTAGEVINPKRNIPLSLFIGTLVVTIIYLLANIVYIKVLPLRGTPEGTDVLQRGIQYATNDRVATAAMSVIFGEAAAIIMAIFIMISTFGCNNGLILAGARVYYAMANDKLFFKKVGQLNKKGVPSLGLIIQGIWASLLCLSGTYSNLLDYVIFSVLIFYVMTIAGIFILRKKKPDAERPYKAFGYPIIPIFYILIASLIMLILLLYKPNYTWPGLIIVLLGIPVYYIWEKMKKKENNL
ncbi:MAG TPA: amino acid permease [Bacteroidota bacterium]|nr:amino acid permease [Bacteroidota bacterium]